MPMETLSQAVNRLTDAGYRDGFRAEPGGLRSTDADCLHEPEELVIEAVERFEGESDPADASILFALHCTTHDVRGTYVVAYGAAVDPADAEMVRRLVDHHGGRARRSDP